MTRPPNKELKLTKPSIMELRSLTPVLGTPRSLVAGRGESWFLSGPAGPARSGTLGCASCVASLVRLWCLGLVAWREGARRPAGIASRLRIGVVAWGAQQGDEADEGRLVARRRMVLGSS